MMFPWFYVVAGLGIAVLSYVVYRAAATPPARKPSAATKSSKPGPSSKTGRATTDHEQERANTTATPHKGEMVRSRNAKAAPGRAARKAKAAASKRTSTPPPAPSSPEIPKLSFEEDDVELTTLGSQTTSLVPATIVYDEDAVLDEPTQQEPLILISATARTDKGIRRKRNEDSVLVREEDGLFVVADGMGGYRGGELASDLAVKTIDEAFTTGTFEGAPHETLPARASELARAIQMANHAIFDRAHAERHLAGMGTTVCAARFSLKKQRLYIGHVGDSRVYCLRGGTLHQMTSDHTMRELGLQGEGASNLSRAVGILGEVPIDIILGKPRPGDVYLLCSDGLTKMVPDDDIRHVLLEHSPQDAVEKLIAEANARGGKDNVTAVVVRVELPRASGDTLQVAS